MYGNTAKSICAKSGLYGGCFRHSNPSKYNSSWVVWEVCAGMLLTHAVPRGQTVNSEHYSKVINIIITFEINELIIFPVNLN
jgi:hypothetical protein